MEASRLAATEAHMKRIFLSVLGAALLLPAAQATANTYDVYSCWAGYGTFRNPNASSVAWTRDQTGAGGHFATGDDCAVNSTNGAMSLISLSGNSAHNGEYARLKFDAPFPSTIGRVDLWRNAWTYGTGSGASSQRNNLRVLAAGTPVSGGADSDGTSDVPLGTRGTSSTTAHGLLAANLLTVDASSLGTTS